MKKTMIEFIVRSYVSIPDEFATSETQAWEYIREHFDQLRSEIDENLDLQYDTIECVEILDDEEESNLLHDEESDLNEDYIE